MVLSTIAPPTVIVEEPSVTVSEDESVMLSCNVDSQPTTSIEVSWFKDNSTTPLQDNGRINIGHLVQHMS